MAQRSFLRDAVIGAAAGAIGTVVMEQFFKVLARLPTDRLDEMADYAEDEKVRALDDVSVTDVEPKEDENAPQTAGRAAYEAMTGHAPSKQMAEKLGTGMHWGMGVGMGALYGVLRGARDDGFDLGGGAAFGTSVWAMADEVAVPMLGLTAGPTAQPPSAHVKGLGAHIVYGVATAAAAQALEKVL